MMRRRLLALMAAGAIGLIAAGVVAVASIASAQPRPSLTEAQILQIALRAAAKSGDPRPTLIQYAEGSHSKANQVASGGYFGGTESSYLIAERGKFVAYHAILPPGASLPRGTAITLVVNATTGRVTDGGVSYRYPPLAQLGPVTTDFRSYSSCPADGRRDFTSAARGADGQMVPSRGADQVLLCRYSGVGPTPSVAGRLLAAHLVTSSASVSQLAGEFDSLPQFQGGAYSCPVDFGVKILAIFRYPPARSSDDPVTVDPNGCATVTNGHVIRTAAFPAGQRLIGQLEGLTRQG